MSTTLRSFGSPTSDDVFVIDVDAGNPGIFVTNAALTSSIRVPRADFLAAVSSELGVVIIDKADLPEVASKDDFGPAYVMAGRANVHQSSFTFNAPDAPASSAEWHRQNAYAHLALADYLERNPPVDEAQVSALAALMRDTENLRNDVDQQARRLIATGKVEVHL